MTQFEDLLSFHNPQRLLFYWYRLPGQTDGCWITGLVKTGVLNAQDQGAMVCFSLIMLTTWKQNSISSPIDLLRLWNKRLFKNYMRKITHHHQVKNWVSACSQALTPPTGPALQHPPVAWNPGRSSWVLQHVRVPEADFKSLELVITVTARLT